MSIAFNFENEGSTIAKIKSTDDKNHKILYLAKEEDQFDELQNPIQELTLNKGKFHLMPDKSLERNIIYIVGPSGSGKSFFTKQYITEHRNIHKNSKVYMFSALDEDETLEGVKDLLRINIDESLIDDPIKPDEFEPHSLVIFDDIDTITNKKLREAVYAIANTILKVGRHYPHISAIFTSHLATMGNLTKIIICESQYFVYFPHASNGRGINYLLQNYLGLDLKLIKEIRENKSRWCVIHNRYPNFIMGEKYIKLT